LTYKRPGGIFRCEQTIRRKNMVDTGSWGRFFFREGKRRKAAEKMPVVIK